MVKGNGTNGTNGKTKRKTRTRKVHYKPVDLLDNPQPHHDNPEDAPSEAPVQISKRIRRMQRYLEALSYSAGNVAVAKRVALISDGDLRQWRTYAYLIPDSTEFRVTEARILAEGPMRVLDVVQDRALRGDMRACKLYFEVAPQIHTFLQRYITDTGGFVPGGGGESWADRDMGAEFAELATAEELFGVKPPPPQTLSAELVPDNPVNA